MRRNDEANIVPPLERHRQTGADRVCGPGGTTEREKIGVKLN